MGPLANGTLCLSTHNHNGKLGTGSANQVLFQTFKRSANDVVSNISMMHHIFSFTIALKLNLFVDYFLSTKV